MKHIDPKNLTIPRAYFTEFDRITYSQVAWSEKDVKKIKLNLERKVKLLGCIKGVVVIATSHLFESELAQEFLKENPIVLEEGIILPALISRYSDFSSFLQHKREQSKEKKLYLSGDKDEINLLLSNSVDKVIKWDVQRTSSWFKHRLLEDLENEKSILRFNLSNVPLSVISDTASCIRQLELPSRSEIYTIAKNSGNKNLWMRLGDYADFIYYLSGARAVNSEGILPQENLIDFSISDLTQRKTKLSEYEIFYRIFVKIIKEKTQKLFPVEILDTLSFYDVVELRNNLLHSSFVEKYNSLIETTKQRIEINDSEQLILTIDELSHFEDELHSIFEDCIVNEINQMKKIKFLKSGMKVLTNVGSLLTFYGTIESITQLAVNVLSFVGLKRHLSQTGNNIEQNINKLKLLVSRSSLDKKPLLINFLTEMRKKYSSKLI